MAADIEQIFLIYKNKERRETLAPPPSNQPWPSRLGFFVFNGLDCLTRKICNATWRFQINEKYIKEVLIKNEEMPILCYEVTIEKNGNSLFPLLGPRNTELVRMSKLCKCKLHGLPTFDLFQISGFFIS